MKKNINFTNLACDFVFNILGRTRGISQVDALTLSYKLLTEYWVTKVYIFIYKYSDKIKLLQTH